ncbi:MAG: hypothetical protein K2Q10_07945, partial [Rhodospirillales bacterium]|nr:hypothetical protein [Rhodospirillales bacterium]
MEAHNANELFLAVVGYAGSGTTRVAHALEALLRHQGYQPSLIKARDIIGRWAAGRPFGLSSAEDPLARTIAYQDLGDAMREADLAAVACGAIAEIRLCRRRALGATKDD